MTRGVKSKSSSAMSDINVQLFLLLPWVGATMEPYTVGNLSPAEVALSGWALCERRDRDRLKKRMAGLSNEFI